MSLVLSAFMFLLCVPGVFKLKEEFGYKAWYNNDDPKMELYRNFEKKFGNDDSVIIAVYNPKGILNAKDFKAISEITDKLWLIQDVFRVDSIVNYDIVHADNDSIDVIPLVDFQKENDFSVVQEKIRADHNITNLLIDEKQTMTLIQGYLRPAFDDPPDYSEITIAVKEMVKPYIDQGLDIRVMGGVALSHYFKKASISDIQTLLPVVFLIFIIILAFIYRRVSGVLLPFIVVALSILTMMGLAGYLGKTINMLSSAAPTILLTVAIADAIHMITSFFISKNEGSDHVTAVRYSLDKNFLPTLFTSLTTAIGFISFATAKVKAIADIGLMISIGVIFAWIYSYFTLGAILRLVDLKVKKVKDKKFNLLSPTGINGFIKKFKMPILLCSFLIMVLGLFSIPKLEVNMDPVGQFRDEHPLVQTVNLITEKMGSFSTMEMEIDSGSPDGIKNPEFLKKVESFEKWLLNLKPIGNTYSVTGIIKELNKNFNNGNKSFEVIPNDKQIIAEELFFYSLGLPEGRSINNRISLNNRFMRLTVNWDVRDSVTANKYMDLIRQEAEKRNLNMVITGKMPLFHDLTGYIVGTFINSFIFAFIAITLILIFILKSVRLALLALIPNLFPLIVGAFLYYISGNFIDVGTVIVASVCLGIAVDDSIHFLYEYKRYRTEGLNTSLSVEKLIKTTYPSLLFTTLTIFVGFGCFVFAEYVPNARFGVMVSVILMFALWADFYILPSILYYVDKDER